MIVVARKVGQLGNRLRLFAHFLACAKENGVTLVNPSFDEYAQYFRTTDRDLLCAYPPRASSAPPPWWTRRAFYLLVYLLARLLAHLRCVHWPLRIIRIPMDERCDLGSSGFAKLVKRRRVVLAQGWDFRSRGLLLKHADAIREHFQPLPRHERNVKRVIAEARCGADVLVGVHIRQTDYAAFVKGRYFFSTGQYRAVMQRVEKSFAPKTVRFLVCSDAAQTVEAFAGLDVVLGTGHLVEDMYALARCDFLIGPPSTYTEWASFYGEVPLCHLVSPDMAVDRQGFTVFAV